MNETKQNKKPQQRNIMSKYLCVFKPTGHRPFQCNVTTCLKTFSQKCALNLHILSHTAGIVAIKQNNQILTKTKPQQHKHTIFTSIFFLLSKNKKPHNNRVKFRRKKKTETTKANSLQEIETVSLFQNKNFFLIIRESKESIFFLVNMIQPVQNCDLFSMQSLFNSIFRLILLFPFTFSVFFLIVLLSDAFQMLSTWYEWFAKWMIYWKCYL